MPLIKKYNLLFVHIPKTGGTSIEHKFHIRSGKHSLRNKVEEVVNHITMAPQHFPLFVLKERLKERYDTLRKFTFVRNPYTRILSEYVWQINSEQKQNVSMQGFNDWLPKYLSVLDRDHKLPQSVYVDDTVDFIGKFEQLQQDFNRLVETFDIEIDTSLPHANRSKWNKEKKIKEISTSNIKLINSIYKQDFEQFGYKIIGSV